MLSAIDATESITTLGAARQSLAAEEEGFRLSLVGMVAVVGRVLLVSVPRPPGLKVVGVICARVFEIIVEFIVEIIRVCNARGEAIYERYYVVRNIWATAEGDDCGNHVIAPNIAGRCGAA